MINFPSSPATGDIFQDGTPRAWYWSGTAWIPCDLSLGLGLHRIFTKDDGTILTALTVSAGNNQSGYAATYGYGAALTVYGGQYTGAAGYFQLQARSDASTATTLTGTPAGVLTWGGDVVLTSKSSSSGRHTTTPTVTATSGAFTTVACEVNYGRVDDMVIFDVTITITTNGTAAGYINVPMPFTAVKETVFAGREDNATGNMCQGIMAASSSTLKVARYDNAYAGGTGTRITLSGHAFI